MIIPKLLWPLLICTTQHSIRITYNKHNNSFLIQFDIHHCFAFHSLKFIQMRNNHCELTCWIKATKCAPKQSYPQNQTSRVHGGEKKSFQKRVKQVKIEMKHESITSVTSICLNHGLATPPYAPDDSPDLLLWNSLPLLLQRRGQLPQGTGLVYSC